MRLASLWVPTATVLWASGCFSPNLQSGDRCTEQSECPSGLTCTNGFCCADGDSACGVLPDAGPDVPDPDADMRAFVEHLDPYGCDPNTLYLFHFDEQPDFENAQGACVGSGVTVFEDSTAVESFETQFGMAAEIGSNGLRTKYIEGDEGTLPVGASAFTIEGWFSAARPSGTDIAVIASALRPVATAIEDATFLVGLNSDGTMAIELFESDCKTRSPRSFRSNVVIDDNELHHFRLVVTTATTRLYVDAVLDQAATISNICTDVRQAALRVAGVDVDGDTFEFGNLKSATGTIDEIRYSNIAR